MSTGAKRILWVDDEIDLLRPHLLFLEERGYRVDAVSNGDDALALLHREPYDLILLDEQMPGMRGLEVLEELHREDPHARVIMITKSEEDRTMKQAIGRRVDDYLVKPTSPRQVLSAVTRILEGSAILQEQAARDFADHFSRLTQLKDSAGTPGGFIAAYTELVDWHVRLEAAGEEGLADTVASLLVDLRRNFGSWVVDNYPAWVGGRGDRPELSVDVVRRHLLPLLGEDPVLLVILDCMRLDQWRVMASLLAPYFDIEERHHFSILPTATPYARNAIFGGIFPDEIAERRAGWWDRVGEDGSMNDFEDELLAQQLEELTGESVPVHYDKIFSDRDSERVRARIHSALRTPGTVVALVFNFVDLIIHGRSESPILMEVARDEAALRALTRSWFERSTAFEVLKEAASKGFQVLLTTDHGSILCNSPTTVYARRDATDSLRYKFGADLRAEEPGHVLRTENANDLRLPPGQIGMSYMIALEDHFFVYPTKLREYQARYRNSFLHGGVSPEEMIVPVARLTPRRR